MNILLFLGAIFPGLFICYLIFDMDKYEKEPKIHLLVCFLLGVLCTLPAIQMETFGEHFLAYHGGSLIKIFFFATFVISLSEEILKFFALLLYAYPRKVFNEPLDGIVYSVMVGMGFATWENVLYAQKFGYEAVFARAVTAVPAHALFALAMGYYVGKAKFATTFLEKIKFISIGFFLAVTFHGAYDFLLLQEEYQLLMMLATLLVVIGVYFGKKTVHAHQAISPFRDDHHDELSVNDLANMDRTRFIQDTEIIESMLEKMMHVEILVEQWADVFKDSATGDKWLRFHLSSTFTEDVAPRMVRLPGPSAREVLNLAFSTDYEDEIVSAAEFLRLRELYHQEVFREKLLTQLEEFDAENLSDIHRERFIMLILETKLNHNGVISTSETAERAHRLLTELC